MTYAKIALTSSGLGTVELDGMDVASAVRSLCLTAGVGEMPELAIATVPRGTAYEGEVRVTIDEALAVILVAAGWKPPSDELA